MRLINGDSAEELRGIGDGMIDMVLTSPSYDKLRTYNGIDWSFDKFKVIAGELFRVLKDGGIFYGR